MARIENHKFTVSEAFQECFYIVPDYQREYVWTDKGTVGTLCSHRGESFLSA